MASDQGRYGRWAEEVGNVVVDAITATMNEGDAQAEAAAFLDALDGAGFKVVRVSNPKASPPDAANCICGHTYLAHVKSGNWYATGLGTVGPMCSACGCAYFVWR